MSTDTQKIIQTQMHIETINNYIDFLTTKDHITAEYEIIDEEDVQMLLQILEKQLSSLASIIE
jgi:uncharacterized protein YlaN (UPF0358 family)